MGEEYDYIKRYESSGTSKPLSDEIDPSRIGSRKAAKSIDTEQLFTNSIPASYVVWKDNSGNIYADAQDSDLASLEGSDFSTVLQNAIDNLPSDRKGKIQISSGLFLMSSGIDMRERTMIEGQGIRSTEFKLEDNSGVTNIFDFAPGTQAGYVVFRDFFIDGNKGNGNPDSRGIRCDSYATDSRISNVGIMSCGVQGINLNNTWGWQLKRGYTEYCDGNGVTLDGDSAGANVIGWKSMSNTDYGVLCKANNCKIIGGEWLDNSTGIYLMSLRNRVANVGVQNCSIGLRAYNCSDNYISNSYFLSNTSNDLRIDSNASDIHFSNVTYGTIDRSGSRITFDGLGINGANDPSSAGDWNGNGYEGVRVLWNDGANYYISFYRGGTWYDIQVDSPTV